MCESKPFSHDQSLCHELVQAFSEALSLRGDRRHCFKNGEDRSPRETLLSPAIFFFFERDELKCSSEQVCHELGGDGYFTGGGRVRRAIERVGPGTTSPGPNHRTAPEAARMPTHTPSRGAWSGRPSCKTPPQLTASVGDISRAILLAGSVLRGPVYPRPQLW